MTSNWVADSSRAPKPPNYFLQRIYDYDAMLVIMPSRDNPGAYVIGRRKQWGRGITEAAIDAVYTKQDTKMCILNGCVPVCLMMQSGVSWDPEQIIAKLAARDMWTLGGAEKVADMLEAQEEAEKAKTRAATTDDIRQRSREAWRSYQARTGQSTIRFNDYMTSPRAATPNVSDSPTTGEVAAPSNTAGARSTAGLAADTAGLSVGAEPQG